jgi:hypothetical protein
MFGMFGPLMGQLQQPLPQDAGKPKHKTGMFGGGKPDWVGAISAGLGALSAARGNPAGQIALQMLNQRLGQKREDQQYERRQSDEWNMWQRQQQWKLQNPGQPDYGEFERALIGKGIQPGSPEWAKAMGTRVDNMLDPAVNTAYGPVLRSQIVGAQPPAKPLTDDDIVRMTQGGPAATPPATFPFRF